MGTAHGAEELGLCPHGLACQAGAWGRYIGVCLGYDHIWKIQTNKLISWGSPSETVNLTTGPQILNSIKILLEVPTHLAKD